MDIQEKSRILAVPESYNSNSEAFFVQQFRLSNPSLPTVRYIKDSLAIIGCDSLSNLNFNIMPENRKTQLYENPVQLKPKQILKDFTFTIAPEQALEVLEKMAYYKMSHPQLSEKDRIEITNTKYFIDNHFKQLRQWNKNRKINSVC